MHDFQNIYFLMALNEGFNTIKIMKVKSFNHNLEGYFNLRIRLQKIE